VISACRGGSDIFDSIRVGGVGSDLIAPRADLICASCFLACASQGNRTAAKLKQSKLETRREQWLSGQGT
jgi:hypothetical protein